jgi:hypothetical protein
MRFRQTLALLAVLAAALPATAGANAADVIADCADDGQLSGRYSARELEQARRNLPADLDEYSDCREVIGAAIPGGSDRRRGGGSGGGSAKARKAAAPTGDDHAALERALDSDKPTVKLGGASVEPGDNGLFHLATAANGLPGPLLAALIALGAVALAGGALVLRRRLPAHALERVPRPRFLRR